MSWEKRPQSAASTRRQLIQREFSITTHNVSALSIHSKLVENARVTSHVRNALPRVDTGKGSRNAAVAYWLDRRRPDSSSRHRLGARPTTQRENITRGDVCETMSNLSASPTKHSVEMSPLWGSAGGDGMDRTAAPPLRAVVVEHNGVQATMMLPHQCLTFHCPIVVDIEETVKLSSGRSTVDADISRGEVNVTAVARSAEDPSSERFGASQLPPKSRDTVTKASKSHGSKTGGAMSSLLQPATAAELFAELLTARERQALLISDVVSSRQNASVPSVDEARLLGDYGYIG